MLWALDLEGNRWGGETTPEEGRDMADSNAGAMVAVILWCDVKRPGADLLLACKTADN